MAFGDDGAELGFEGGACEVLSCLVVGGWSFVEFFGCVKGSGCKKSGQQGSGCDTSSMHDLFPSDSAVERIMQSMYET